MARSPAFADDSRLLAFIEAADGGSRLVALDSDTGARATLVSAATARTLGRPKTAAAALLRERRRAPAEGLTDFAWVPSSPRVLVPLGQAIMNLDAQSAISGGAGAAAAAPGGPGHGAFPVLEVQALASPVVLPGQPPVPGSDLVRVARDAEPVDVKPSPCGRFIGFVLDDELCVARADGVGPVLQVTCGARGTRGQRSNASADFLSAEEFDRYSGWWWSPDSSRVLVQSTDNSPVSEVLIPRLTADRPDDEDAVERHRYAFAGGDNPVIGFRVIDVAAALRQVLAAGSADDAALPAWPGVAAAPPSSPTRGPLPLRPLLVLTDPGLALELCLGEPRPDGSAPDVYVCHAGFCPDSSVFLQVVSRDHSRLDLVRYCPSSGRAELLVREAAPTSWVNADKLLTFIDDPTPAAGSPAGSPSSLASPRSRAFPASPYRSRERIFFVWASERSGFRHLYLYAVRKSFSFEADLTIARAKAAAIGGDPDAVGTSDDLGIPTGPGDPRSVVLADAAAAEATLRRPITGGEWVVTDGPPCTGNSGGVAVSAASHSVFFAANAASPLERHVYRAPILMHRGVAPPRQHGPASPGAANAWTPGGSASSPRPAPRRSLRPRVGGLLSLGRPLDDLHSWGLTVGTYSVTQVTPGTRGRSGMVFSPDCTRAVLTRASIDVERGAVTTDVVRLTFPRDIPVAPGPSSPPASAVPRLLSTPGKRGGAEAGPAEDVTAASTPAGPPDGVEGPSAFLEASAAPSPAAGAAPRPSFPFPAPDASVSPGFPLDVDLESPSGFTTTLLTRIAGPDTALTEPALAAADDEGDAAPAEGDETEAAPAGHDDTEAAPAQAAASRLAGRVSRDPAGPARGVHFFACPAHDGTTTLFGTLRLPEGQDDLPAEEDADGRGAAPPPAVLFVYAGPHVQLVRDDARVVGGGSVGALRRRGAAVFTVDGRGTSERGRRFETATNRAFGVIDVADQLAAAQFLADRRLIDPARLGVFGWSYGGFMTLMMLSKSVHKSVAGMRPAVADADTEEAAEPPSAGPPPTPVAPPSPTAGPAGPPSPRSEPEAPPGPPAPGPVCFSVGVAGGSVTEWENYDTAYTERYMGTPQEEPDAYARGSAVRAVEGLRGKRVLLVHGAMDENVLLRNTQRLVAAAIRAKIDVESFVLPDSRHGPGVAGPAVASKTEAFLAAHLGLE